MIIEALLMISRHLLNNRSFFHKKVKVRFSISLFLVWVFYRVDNFWILLHNSMFKLNSVQIVQLLLFAMFAILKYKKHRCESATVWSNFILLKNKNSNDIFNWDLEKSLKNGKLTVSWQCTFKKALKSCLGRIFLLETKHLCWLQLPS